MITTLLVLKMATDAMMDGADVEIGLGAPLLIDMAILYIVAAYLGVVPSLV